MDNAHAAAVFGGVTADPAAVEVEIAAIQRHTAALLQPGVPGKRAAVEVDIRRLGENAAAFVAAGASAQRAGADAVADVHHREVRALRAAQEACLPFPES